MPEPDRPAPESNFATTVATLEDGRLRDELDRHLATLVTALHEHRKTFGGKPKASLAVTLSLTLDGRVVEILSVVKAEPPKPVRSKSIYFGTKDGKLQRQDPGQMEFTDLRDASTTASPLRRA